MGFDKTLTLGKLTSKMHWKNENNKINNTESSSLQIVAYLNFKDDGNSA